MSSYIHHQNHTRNNVEIVTEEVGAGVIGVAATGWMVEKAGTGLLGWYQAFSIAALLCVASSLYFLAFAAGEKIFGETDQF